MRYVCMLMLTMLIVAGPWAGRKAEGSTIPVPYSYQQISAAISVASSGDSVVVSNNGLSNTAYLPFTMKRGVSVVVVGGQVPKITGTGASYAVTFPVDADDETILEGFAEITTGSVGAVYVRGSGIVRDCTIVSTDPYTSLIGVQGYGTDLVVDGCTIEIASGTGIHFYQSSGLISNCSVESDTAGIILADGGSIETTTVTLTDPLTASAAIDAVLSGYGDTVEDCLTMLAGTDGQGIFAQGGTVEGCTAIGGAHGFWTVSGGVTTNCIAADFDAYGFYCTTAATYCVAEGASGFFTGSAGTGCDTSDPLFCDASNGVYTLRVDSYGNPENNDSGERIGAFDVACLYGTLQRDATYAGDGTLDFPGDATVPSGRTLTLEAGTTLLAGPGDSQSGGTNSSQTELIVGGRLDVVGGDGSPVTFTSAASTPDEGDWYGVRVTSGGTAFIDSAELYYGVYGVTMDGPIDGGVTSSDFAHNEIYDIAIEDVGSTYFVAVEDNTIAVGGGSGVLVTGGCPGLEVRGNVITGTGDSYAGIDLIASPGSATIEENEISGFENGSGIEVTSDSPTLLKNEIDDCKYGIYVTGGSPAVGTTSTSSDNVITGCTNGIRAYGSGATPVVRNNNIHGNATGVLTIGNANPFLGSSGDDAKNSIYNNTSYCIWNRNSSQGLIAAGNWFGQCSQPTCASGTVVILSWLCTQPASVGRRPEIAVVGPAQSLRILGARPNPAREGTAIAFSLDGTGDLGADVFDVSGRLVRSLDRRGFGPGDQEIRWDGLDGSGRAARAGIYFVRLQGDRNLVGTTKVLVVK